MLWAALGARFQPKGNRSSDGKGPIGCHAEVPFQVVGVALQRDGKIVHLVRHLSFDIAPHEPFDAELLLLRQVHTFVEQQRDEIRFLKIGVR